MEDYKLTLECIYNVDETCLTSVRKPAMRGARQVGQVPSTERGTLVTMCSAVNALGKHYSVSTCLPTCQFQRHYAEGSPN